MVEVGLVLPIFILTVIAVLEFGYFAAVSAAVQTASREGARYGSTVDDTDGTPNYLECSEIRDHARDLAEPLVSLPDSAIAVGYDTDGGTNVDVVCAAGLAESAIERWDRMIVTVTYDYSPITPIMDLFIGTETLTSVDRRSIVKCDDDC